MKTLPKMDIAKQAVRELIANLPDDARIGLVVYSHRKLKDCEDIELMIPPGRVISPPTTPELTFRRPCLPYPRSAQRNSAFSG